MALICSCDPGLAGHWTLMRPNGEIIKDWPMPLDKAKKFCPRETLKLLKEIDNIAANEFEEIFVCIEQLLTLPSDRNQLEVMVSDIEAKSKDGKHDQDAFDRLNKQLKRKDGILGIKTQSVNWGILIGQFVALGWRYVTVAPRTWQNAVWQSGEKRPTAKLKSYDTAKKLFPHINLETKRGKIKDGLIDSLLIGEYARRTFKL